VEYVSTGTWGGAANIASGGVVAGKLVN
jgi:hypothetical protein